MTKNRYDEHCLKMISNSPSFIQINKIKVSVCKSYKIQSDIFSLNAYESLKVLKLKKQF